MAQNTRFCFHNYSFEIIITFELLFLPPNPPTYLSPPSFKITAWSFTNHSYMHICTYIYIPKYTLLSLYNITCMHVFIWSIGVFSSRENRLIHSQLSSVAHSFLCKAEAFSPSIWHVYQWHPSSALTGSDMLVRLPGCSLWHSLKPQSHGKLYGSLTLTIVLSPLHQCSLNLQ